MVEILLAIIVIQLMVLTLVIKNGLRKIIELMDEPPSIDSFFKNAVPKEPKFPRDRTNEYGV